MTEGGLIVTQERDMVFPYAKRAWSTDPNTLAMTWQPYAGAGERHSGIGIHPLRQLTTSFRSGHAVESRSITPQELIAQNEVKNQRPYDNGHEFFTSKESVTGNYKTFFTMASNTGQFYRGPLVVGQFADFLSSNDSTTRHPFQDIDLAVGTQFLNQLRPTAAAANVAQALGELFVDLPKIPFAEFHNLVNISKYPRAVASEILGLDFAWVPLVKDVQKICRSIVYANDIIKQYQRDAGRLIRRSVIRPEHILYNTSFDYVDIPLWNIGTLDNTNSDIFDNDASRAVGLLSVTEKESYTYSFSGAFEYLFTADDTFVGRMAQYGQLANKLLGVRLTPDVLWQLAPWSWLLDWFVDFGPFIGLNVSINQDNLVIAYGYLMRTSFYERTYTHTGIHPLSGKTGPLVHSYRKIQKERVRATPYGFGVALDSLSENQWSILALLGLTKGNKRFWWG